MKDDGRRLRQDGPVSRGFKLLCAGSSHMVGFLKLAVHKWHVVCVCV